MGTGIRYTRGADGGHIAYTVAGAGDVDLVVVGGWVWSTTAGDGGPQPFSDRMKRFARVISYDQRGSGRSDPIDLASRPRVEDWLDDLGTVLDAAGCDRPTLYAYDSAGPLAILYAAAHPDRVGRLVLAATFARAVRGDGYECGIPPEGVDHLVEWVEAWSTGNDTGTLVDTFEVADDPDRFLDGVRTSITPGTAAALTRMMVATDVRHALPRITMPTLVLHGTRDRYLDVGHGRHLAAHIPGAELVELPTGHLLDLARTEALDALERFVTGETRHAGDDRILAVVLFTDIAGSTRTNAALGDRRWSDVLTGHDLRSRRAVVDAGGRVVKHVGDGLLATFDRPSRALRAALAIVVAAAQQGVEVKAGLHVGEITVVGDDITGMAVNVAARIVAMAEPGQVLVSRTVGDMLLGSDVPLDPVGPVELRGVPGTWELLEVGRC